MNLEKLSEKHRIHKKSRTTKHSLYPRRYFVPDNKVQWDENFHPYNPPPFTAPVVLDPNTSWADPADVKMINREIKSSEGQLLFTPEGIPLNPFGRTGIRARGILGKWGPNLAVDGMITTIDESTGLLKVLTIKRKDTGEHAFPGGMTDPGETALVTRNRELAEELAISEKDLANPLYESEVYQGYVDDPRNTDNAWLETAVIHSHISKEVATKMNLKAGDDATDFEWCLANQELVDHFYASHGLFLLIGLKDFMEKYKDLTTVMRDQILELL